MTPPKKRRPQAFTSFRIIGKKAQTILNRAKKSDNGKRKTSRNTAPSRKEHEEFVMHLSTFTVMKATFTFLAIVIGMFLLYQIRDKIILLLLSFFVASVIDPGVLALQRMHIPRGVAILLHYVIALFLLIFLLVSFIPIIADQIQQIALYMSALVDHFLAEPSVSIPFMNAEFNERITQMVQVTLQDRSIDRFSDTLLEVGRNLSTAAQGSVRFAAQLAGSVLNFVVKLIVVLVLAFFIQLEKETIIEWVRSMFPHQARGYLDSKSEAIHSKIAQWARGEMLLMLSIFLLTLVALVIVGMPYALTLAVLAGFCEFIPAVGPFIAAVPAVLIALTQKGLLSALVVAGVYYIIQWCENNLLVPLIMKRAVGLSPIAILFAMMVGISFSNTIHPIIGVMLAIPTTTIIKIFLDDWKGNKSPH